MTPWFEFEEMEEGVEVVETIHNGCTGEGPASLPTKMEASFRNHGCTVLDIVRFVQDDSEEVV